MFLKGSFILFLLLSLLLIVPADGFSLPAEVAGGGTAGRAPIEGNIDDIAKTIQTYFPKVNGKITAVEGDRVEADLGRESGTSVGILLTVYREKGPFYHPVTGVVLGKFEEEVGTIEVAEIDDRHLIANKVRSASPIQVGDYVRIPGTRIPMAVSLTSSESQIFLMNELVSALTDTGRFRIDVLSPQSTREEAAKKNARYLLQLATSEANDVFFVKLNLQNTETGKSLSDMEVKVSQAQGSDLILEHLQYQLFEQRR